MKFSPTWQQVVLLGVLLAAVIVSHGFFPMAAAAVVSIVSTIVGAMFVNLNQPKAPEMDAEATPARVLTLVPKPADKPEGDA